VIGDLQKLKKFAKDNDMYEKLFLMLGTAELKVEAAWKKQQGLMKKLEEKEAKRKQKEGKYPFSSASMIVRPFKDSMSSGKKCNVKKVTPKEFANMMKTGKIDFKEPLLIKGGVDKHIKLKAKYNVTSLRAIPKETVTIQYLSPVMAKMKRQGGDPSQEENTEAYQPQMISFDKYFQNCFGNSRSPGTHTEHCEQVRVYFIRQYQYQYHITLADVYIISPSPPPFP
jgi:hypothetical protein